MLRVALGGSVPWLDSGGWRLGMYQALGSVCIVFFLSDKSKCNKRFWVLSSFIFIFMKVFFMGVDY